MRILAIETSCDETAISIIETTTSGDNIRVLSDMVMTQIDIHKEYGGVFPALAKREHAKNLVPLFAESLHSAGLYTEKEQELDTTAIKQILEREPELFTALDALARKIEKPDIDMIAVTYGPGLAPALWVGVNFARALSELWNIPLMPINHMEGHIVSVLAQPDYQKKDAALLSIPEQEFPLLALLISGGHTQLVLVRDWTDYKIIGETIDDAVGEAFDKVARLLGMEYPGGPKISKAAQDGVEDESISLPRPMLHSKDLNFSFSGLKTSARYLIDDLKREDKLDTQTINSIAREFQQAATDVLLKKTKSAIEQYGAQGLIIAGGVSANKHIRGTFTEVLTRDYGIPVYTPPLSLCGDNSFMIAIAAYMHTQRQKKTTPQNEVVAHGNASLAGTEGN
jgi:N6-L-threonylcarbamoyladenine synthase